MQNCALVSFVYFVDCLKHLRKYFPYGLFRQIPSVFDDSSKKGIKITTLAVLHNQVDFHGNLVKNVFIVLDNMCTLEFS
jgi:hypothetical protein